MATFSRKLATAALIGMLAVGSLTACESTKAGGGNGCKMAHGCKGAAEGKAKNSCKAGNSCKGGK